MMKQTQPFFTLNTPVLYTVYSLCVWMWHIVHRVYILCLNRHSVHSMFCCTFHSVLQHFDCKCAVCAPVSSLLRESTCHSFVSFCSYFCVKWCVTKHNSNIGTITTITCFSSLSCVQAWNVSVLCCVCAFRMPCIVATTDTLTAIVLLFCFVVFAWKEPWALPIGWKLNHRLQFQCSKTQHSTVSQTALSQSFCLLCIPAFLWTKLLSSLITRAHAASSVCCDLFFSIFPVVWGLYKETPR